MAKKPHDTPGTFHGEIVVASRIVDYLSSGLYDSPAASLKELVNNSYDADASRADIFIKPDANRIIIEDDGIGMNQSDFVRHFSRISESHKREDSDHTPKGRAMIGKIGIGFIAANELCDVMEIVSTKEGDPHLLSVTIRFDLMRQDVKDRKRSDLEYAKADYHGTVTQTHANDHYTRVFLKEIRGEAKAILAGAGSTAYSAGEESLYGLLPETVAQKLVASGLRSWSNFDAYSLNMLRIALNVPVMYHDAWMPKTLKPKLSDITRDVRSLGFRVYMDGSELRKPILFRPRGKTLISRFEFNGASVSAKGYFYAQNKGISPQELQGLLVRIRNAAVGDYDPSFLGFSSSLGPLFQTWISAEVLADDRLEEALNIDRRTLRITHPAYVELQGAVHEHLAALLKRVRKEIYGTGSAGRARQKARRVQSSLEELASRDLSPISPAAARRLVRAARAAASSPAARRRLTRKVSIDELLKIVIEAATQVLSPTKINEFLVELIRRLLG
jgi:hypothetical protein